MKSTKLAKYLLKNTEAVLTNVLFNFSSSARFSLTCKGFSYYHQNEPVLQNEDIQKTFCARSHKEWHLQ